MKCEVALDSPAYNLALHTAPVQENSLEYYHWHIEFIPKLTNTAGFEWGTGFYINPTPPEESAKFLREADVSAGFQRREISRRRLRSLPEQEPASCSFLARSSRLRRADGSEAEMDE